MVINKICTWKETNTPIKRQITPSYTTMFPSILKLKKHLPTSNKRLSISKKSKSNVNVTLILLCGDVHKNPGPNPAFTCSNCQREITDYTAAMKCDTCKQWCHDKCGNMITANQTTLGKGSKYSWICPNTSCKPNYNQPTATDLNQGDLHESNVVTSPNRFTILVNLKEQTVEGNKIKRPQKSKTASVKRTVRKNDTAYNLWSEITKISPTDYQGKELCKGCNSEIRKSQRAISCDSCHRWIHQKCSDMKDQTYKANMKKKHFPWTCNVCRIDESNTYDKPDFNLLKPEEMPETLETVKISNTPKDMLIIHMNCRSVVNKTEELEHICNTLQPDIVCLTETWLDESVQTQSCSPTGYRMIRKDRSDEYKQKYGRNKGGGVAICYKEHIKVEKKDYITEECEEILWVQVKAKESFILGLVYRADYTDLLNEKQGECKLEENIRKVSEITNRVIIAGDFNIDNLCPNTNSEQLKNIYKCYGLSQLINKPTRVDKRTGKPTLIDHIWSNKELHIIKKVGTFMGISDHFGTYMRLSVKKQPKQDETIRFRSYRKYNPDLFKNDLEQKLKGSDILKYIEDNDVNGATEELVKVIQEAADIHAPEKEIKISKIKTKVPWFSEDLTEKINQKNSLLSDYFTCGLDILKERANKLKNEINHLKRKLKKKYYTEKVGEMNGDARTMWKILKGLTGTGKNLETVEPEMLTQEKVNTFNKFFATVGAEIQKKLKIQLHSTDLTGLDGFKFKDETTDNILKLIDRIRIDVAVGNDKVSARLIKDAKFIISPYLTKIINIGYKARIFPDCMKTTIIKALHKKKSTDDIANYRPISILPTLSKVFERSATDQMITFLESNNKISKNQHAYRSKHSTQTCLVEVINHIYKLLDQKRHCAIASLDLSKAFDSISHTLILHKLSKLGLGGECLAWIKSYLHNRKQRTKFRSFESEEETVLSGIPQGSIIGPLLFICFTNDLAEEFEDCKMVAYADDTQLIVDAPNINQLKTKIEKVIKTAQTWYEHNSMKNNIGKSEILTISPGKINRNKMKITVIDDGEPIVIETAQTIKILGVKIDENLNWKKQVNSVKRKSMNSIRNLNRVNNLLPIKYRIQLYKSLIEPLFSYADVVWGGCGKTTANSLQLAQNFAARSILGMKKSDSATTALKKLKFLNLSQRRRVHETVFTHKSLIHKHPDNINDAYEQQLSKVNTRSAANMKLTIPKHRTSKYERSPFYRTITAWNAVPSTIPTGHVIKHKTMYQHHLINGTH